MAIIKEEQKKKKKSIIEASTNNLVIASKEFSSTITKLTEIVTDGFEIVENALSKKDLPSSDIHCHVCGSDNISIQKGSGELIIGDDRIALVCHDCEKIYKFNDIKYRITA